MVNARLAAGVLAGSLLIAGCGSTVTGSATAGPGAKTSASAPSSSAPASIPSIPSSDPNTGGGGGSSSGSCSGLPASAVSSAFHTSGITTSNQSSGGGGSSPSGCVFLKDGSPLLALSKVSLPTTAPIAASKFVEGASRGKQTQKLNGVGDAAAYLAKSDLGGPGVVAAQNVGGKLVGVVLFSTPQTGVDGKSALSGLATMALQAGA